MKKLCELSSFFNYLLSPVTPLYYISVISNKYQQNKEKKKNITSVFLLVFVGSSRYIYRERVEVDSAVVYTYIYIYIYIYIYMEYISTTNTNNNIYLLLTLISY